MNFLKLAQTRYTTKTYSNQRIPEEKIQELGEILRLCPSSINSQPWQFVFVSDEKLKNDAFAKVSFINEQRVREASHLVVFRVIASEELFEEKSKSFLSETGANFYRQTIKAKGEAFVRSWLAHQVYIALGYFLSACASIGIDSTPMEGILPEEYDKILQENDYRTLFAVAIGYRNPEDKNQPSFTPKKRLPLEEVVKNK